MVWFSIDFWIDDWLAKTGLWFHHHLNDRQRDEEALLENWDKKRIREKKCNSSVRYPKCLTFSNFLIININPEKIINLINHFSYIECNNYIIYYIVESSLPIFCKLIVSPKPIILWQLLSTRSIASNNIIANHRLSANQSKSIDLKFINIRQMLLDDDSLD